MNVDDYINNLQSDLDSQLARFGLGGQPTGGIDDTEDVGEKKFCPNCGIQVEAGANFCPECGYNFNVEDSDTSVTNDNFDAPSNWNESRDKEGIIWTDTKELAKKYGITHDNVLDIINGFIDANNEMDIEWHLLDMAEYQHELGEATWMDYSDVLQQYIKDEHIQAGPHLSLFIIGGNDVIPQPAEDNPCYSPSPWSDGTYEDRVHADFYYCFYGPLPLDFLDFRQARCNVARLPLETGALHTTIEEDLQAYFNISNMVTEDGGIDIGRAVMTSNSDWIPASREMSRNLPTEHMDNEVDVVLDNMFLSPSIMEDMDDDLSERYYEKLSEADMLMFNLHGACNPKLRTRPNVEALADLQEDDGSKVVNSNGRMI